MVSANESGIARGYPETGRGPDSRRTLSLRPSSARAALQQPGEALVEHEGLALAHRLAVGARPALGVGAVQAAVGRVALGARGALGLGGQLLAGRQRRVARHAGAALLVAPAVAGRGRVR